MTGMITGTIRAALPGLALGCSAAGALAADEGPLSGGFSLGYLAVSGNSDSETVNVGTEVNYDLERWHHALSASAIGANQNSVSTAEAYAAAYDLRYDLNPRTYVFGTVDWQKDKFSGYDRQLYEAVGLGRRFIDTDIHKLSAEAGVGIRQAKLRDGTSQDDTVYLGSGDYAWKISENAQFNQHVGVVSGSDNTYVESISKLKASIVGNLAMALSYTIKHNTDVPVGLDDTDTYTAVSLDYTF